MTAVERKDPFHVGGFRRHIAELLNDGVPLEREHRIPSFFESNRGHRFTTQAGAAHRTGEMPRKDLHVIRQRQQLLVEAGVQLRGILVGPTWQIGTADRADEQRIPVNTNHGSAPRLRSVTSMQTLSGE